MAVKDADVEVVDEDGALGAGASLAQADAVPCGGPPLVVRGAPPMAAMRRTVCPDRTSWGVPLMGRSDARTGWWGRRRRSTRTAVGAQLVDRPSVTFPRLLLGRVAHTGRVISATDDHRLVDQRLIVAQIMIHAAPEGRYGDQWSWIEWFIGTDHISSDVRVVLVLELLCPLLHRHGLALAIVVKRTPVPVRVPVHGSAAYA